MLTLLHCLLDSCTSCQWGTAVRELEWNHGSVEWRGSRSPCSAAPRLQQVRIRAAPPQRVATANSISHRHVPTLPANVKQGAASASGLPKTRPLLPNTSYGRCKRTPTQLSRTPLRLTSARHFVPLVLAPPSVLLQSCLCASGALSRVNIPRKPPPTDFPPLRQK